MLNIGKIDVPKNRWKELAFLLEQRCRGQEVLTSLSPELEKAADDLYARSAFNQAKQKTEAQVKEKRDLETVDINSMQISEAFRMDIPLTTAFIALSMRSFSTLNLIPRKLSLKTTIKTKIKTNPMTKMLEVYKSLYPKHRAK